MLSGIIALLSCATMIYLVFCKPAVKVFGHEISIYWAAPLAGALVLICCGGVSMGDIGGAFFADSEVNPVKILALFLSMTLMSVYLDATGFFGYLALYSLHHAGRSQKRLFITLYAVVSVLTVFTSNDIIVLTFTPFICYFARNAHIDPMPYLMCEFVGANTWSMALVIGNPTNIYLAGSAGIGFAEYIGVMLLPTLAAGIVSLLVLLLIFRKKLAAPIGESEFIPVHLDKPLMWLGLVHLSVCIVLMAVSSYIALPMWIVSVTCFVSLYLLTILYLFFNRKPITPILYTLKRAPFQIVPFILSMFVLVLGLGNAGITAGIAKLLGGTGTVFKYGAASFLSANAVNNIPMSVLFSSIIEHCEAASRVPAVYATVIGSNLGAYLTPMGALAGIMWMGLLKAHDVPFSFKNFVCSCAPVALAAMAAAVCALAFVL